MEPEAGFSAQCRSLARIKFKTFPKKPVCCFWAKRDKFKAFRASIDLFEATKQTLVFINVFLAHLLAQIVARLGGTPASSLGPLARLM